MFFILVKKVVDILVLLFMNKKSKNFITYNMLYLNKEHNIIFILEFVGIIEMKRKDKQNKQ